MSRLNEFYDVWLSLKLDMEASCPKFSFSALSPRMEHFDMPLFCLLSYCYVVLLLFICFLLVVFNLSFAF